MRSLIAGRARLQGGEGERGLVVRERQNGGDGGGDGNEYAIASTHLCK